MSLAYVYDRKKFSKNYPNILWNSILLIYREAGWSEILMVTCIVQEPHSIKNQNINVDREK